MCIYGRSGRPSLPNTNAPKGRTIKPAAKCGQCGKKRRSRIGFGKELGGQHGGQAAENVKIIPFDQCASDEAPITFQMPFVSFIRVIIFVNLR